MAKLRTALSALGAAKDAGRARALFDDPAATIDDAELFPPDSARQAASGARTLLLRVVHDGEAVGADHAAPRASCERDVFAVVHVPENRDFIALLAFNPRTRVEAGLTFGELVETSGRPVCVAMVEEFLGIRVDHVLELRAEALGAVVDEIGTLPVYSRTAFAADGVQFAEGTNRLDGRGAVVFAAASAVDDAGQTRTRNQRALLRALVLGLRSSGLAQSPAKLASVLGHIAHGARKDSRLSTLELGKLGRELRSVAADDLVAVTVPSRSRREEDGSVTVDFDQEAAPALREALHDGQAAEFVRGLASMGY